MSGVSREVQPAPAARQPRRVQTRAAFQKALNEHAASGEHRCRCYSLILFDIGGDRRSTASRALSQALAKRLRAIDVVGWFDKNHLGVILPYCNSNTALGLAADVCHAVRDAISPVYTVHDNPCRVDSRPSCDSCRGCAANAVRLAQLEHQGRGALPAWKRALDILGSLVGLLLLSPIFLVAGLFIKCVSRGPVFFRQERVGHMGRKFRLWKFRTYEHNADTSGHANYVKSLIEGARGSGGASQCSMRKLDRAPGIIPFGNLLRKSCIDEFPQLINVLCGEMSLVGPRPPIGYEVEQYDDWHKGRLLAVPGMTGLWQVSGKNRLTFNEMVRLDIRYLQRSSLWMDLKILLKTPFAIVMQICDSLCDKGSDSSDAGRTAA